MRYFVTWILKIIIVMAIYASLLSSGVNGDHWQYWAIGLLTVAYGAAVREEPREQP